MVRYDVFLMRMRPSLRTAAPLLLAFFAVSATVACGVLLGAGDDDDDSEPTAASPNGVDAGGDEVADGSLRDLAADQQVDSGCAQCASNYCPSGPCDPLVFVTAEDYAGDFSEIDSGEPGLAKLDEACNRSAAKAGILGATFKVWASTYNLVAGDRPSTRMIDTKRPYRRRDGAIVVPSFRQFLDAGLAQRISLTADASLLDAAMVWTGTDAYGAPDPRDCVGWTSGTNGGEDGVVGITTCAPNTTCFTDQWTFLQTDTCDKRRHLYCIEQVP